MYLKSSVLQVKEVEAAAERAAAQSAAVIEEAMAQAEEARRRAEQDTQSRVRCLTTSESACIAIMRKRQQGSQALP